MKSSYRLAAAVCSVFVFSTSAFAHDGNDGGGRRLEKIKQALNLTDEQAQQVKAQFQANRAACSGFTERTEKRACMKEKRQQSKGQLEKILTPEQQKLFAEKREEWKGKREKMKACMAEAKGSGAVK